VLRKDLNKKENKDLLMGKNTTKNPEIYLEPPLWGGTKLNKAGVEVEITDLETKLTVTYESIRKAAKAINSDIKSLSRREKS
jgi:hypothetical protein